MTLKFELKLRRIETRKINIWNDPAAAAAVREVADGNETVPTVMIGSNALVNPSGKQVKEAIARHAPHLL